MRHPLFGKCILRKYLGWYLFTLKNNLILKYTPSIPACLLTVEQYEGKLATLYLLFQFKFRGWPAKMLSKQVNFCMGKYSIHAKKIFFSAFLTMASFV